MESKPKLINPERISSEQEAQIAAIEPLPYRAENASAFKITSHVINLRRRAVRIHELNNFPSGFLRKYFSYVKKEKQIFDFNPVQEVVPWLEVMEQLSKKCPEIYQAIEVYDRAMLEIHRTNEVYTGLLLSVSDNAERARVSAQWQEAMKDVNSKAWPDQRHVAQRDVDWSTAYDTICEIAKIIKPDFDRHELTVRS